MPLNSFSFWAIVILPFSSVWSICSQLRLGDSYYELSWADRVAEVVEHLPRKCKALSSFLSATIKLLGTKRIKIWSHTSLYMQIVNT
jgi:hypothetical protein